MYDALPVVVDGDAVSVCLTDNNCDDVETLCDDTCDDADYSSDYGMARKSSERGPALTHIDAGGEARMVVTHR